MLVSWKYRPRDTFIQRLDPRARLTFMMLVILSIQGAQVWDIRYLIPVSVMVLILYLMARIPWKDVRRVWLFVFILVVLIVGLNALISGRGGPTAVLNEHSPILIQTPALTIPLVGWTIAIKISTVKAFFAITQILRMLTMAAMAIPIPFTIDPSIYGVTFRQMGLPDKASFTMDLAFRFVPTLGRDFTITVDSQRARGYELESLKGGVFDKLRRLAPLIIPVTMQSIVTGEEVVDAMDLRAFGVRKRTWLKQLHLELRDYLFLALGVAIFAGAIFLRIKGLTEFWVPQWFLNLGV